DRSTDQPPARQARRRSHRVAPDQDGAQRGLCAGGSGRPGMIRRVRTFFASMTGRVFIILSLGMGTAALIAVAVTDSASQRLFEKQLVERTADRLQGYVQFLDASPANLRALFLTTGGPGIHLQPADATG